MNAAGFTPHDPRADAGRLADWLDRLARAAPGKVLMRHKRAGIWHETTRAGMRALVAGQAGAMSAQGIGPGRTVLILGENRPELYAAAIAAQALGADAMPLGPEFLRRYGPPAVTPDLVLADSVETARLWNGGAVLLSALAAGPEAEMPAVAPGAVILHDPGLTGAPAALRMTPADLHALAQDLAPGAGAEDRLIAFLPVSSPEDAALSLALPLCAGAVVACVEGPATFPIDLHEVAPTILAAPARAWELLDRDIRRQIGRRRTTGSTLFFRAPLRNAVGLSRCRLARVTEGIIASGVLARLRDWGIPLDPAPAGDEALRREALLRDDPVIDRARLSQRAGGWHADIAPEPGAAARLTDLEGPDALAGAVAQAARKAGIADFDLLPQGFAPHELTLTGAVRRGRFSRPAAAAARDGRTAGRRFGEMLMETRAVSIAFGGVKALTDVSMQVRRGEILSIIGPNGAGKTSLLNALNGIYTPRSGTIVFQGKERARMRPADAARSGIGRTFQHVALFPGLSVVENVMVGRSARFRAGFLARALRLPSALAEEAREREASEALLEFLDLSWLRHSPVGILPYGLQKRVELARALATEPSLLLLDEPMAGMTHDEKQDMCRFIRAANADLGTTVVLIEHDIGVVMGLSDRVVVLNYGRKIADGLPAEVRENPEVVSAYLGTGAGTRQQPQPAAREGAA